MNINFEHKFLNHILSRGYDYYMVKWINSK